MGMHKYIRSCTFHSWCPCPAASAVSTTDYIEFLERITPDNTQEFATQLKRYNMGAPGESDCPVFDGMLDYFALLSGGSVDGAALLANKDAQIAVNWAGE